MLFTEIIQDHLAMWNKYSRAYIQDSDVAVSKTARNSEYFAQNSNTYNICII